MKTETFSEWIEEQLNLRGWKPADLARAARVGQTTISNIINGNRNPGPDFCISIARALNVPTELVFRKAGILPPSLEERRAADPKLDEAMLILEQLDEAQRETVLTMLRGFQQQPGAAPATPQPVAPQRERAKEEPSGGGRMPGPATGTVLAFRAIAHRVLGGDWWRLPGRLAAWVVFPKGVPQETSTRLQLGESLAITLPGSMRSWYPIGLALVLHMLVQRVINGFDPLVIARLSAHPQANMWSPFLLLYFCICVITMEYLLLVGVVQTLYHSKSELEQLLYNIGAAVMMVFNIGMAIYVAWYVGMAVYMVCQVWIMH